MCLLLAGKGHLLRRFYILVLNNSYFIVLNNNNIPGRLKNTHPFKEKTVFFFLENTNLLFKIVAIDGDTPTRAIFQFFDTIFTICPLVENRSEFRLLPCALRTGKKCWSTNQENTVEPLAFQSVGAIVFIELSWEAVSYWNSTFSFFKWYRFLNLYSSNIHFVFFLIKKNFFF